MSPNTVVEKGMDLNFDVEVRPGATAHAVPAPTSKGDAQVVTSERHANTSEATVEWSETMHQAIGAYGEAIRKLADR